MLAQESTVQAIGFARSTTLWTTTVLMDKEKEVWLQPMLLLGF
jgi:hypothetical protein